MNALSVAKQTFRASASAQRIGLDPKTAGQALTRHVLHDCPPPPGAIVSGFWPMGDEIDIRPLLQALHEQGHRIALPVTPPKGQPLIFQSWHPNDVLVQERFGTMRPIGEVLTPDVLLIPLLAFDGTGGRLGYGGGFYDRTLASLPNRFRLGCAFAVQQVDSVPVGPYDIPLDAVATENGIIRFGRPCEDTVSR